MRTNKINEDKIFNEVGETIKTVQYIEYNLLERLGCDPHDEKTLGQIVGLVEKAKILSARNLTELKKILETRNDLVHHFFKRLNFEEQSKNQKFLLDQLRFLEKFSNRVNNFNNHIVKVKVKVKK